MSERPQSPDELVAVATLEMKPGERMRGALIPADGVRKPFSGWVEFAVVVQDWRATSHDSADSPRKDAAV